MERLLLDWTGQAEQPAQSLGTSRLSISSAERPSVGTSQLCALPGISKSWQDRCEQAWSSIASMSTMGNPSGAAPQTTPGPQVEDHILNEIKCNENYETNCNIVDSPWPSQA